MAALMAANAELLQQETEHVRQLATRGTEPVLHASSTAEVELATEDAVGSVSEPVLNTSSTAEVELDTEDAVGSAPEPVLHESTTAEVELDTEDLEGSVPVPRTELQVAAMGHGSTAQTPAVIGGAETVATVRERETTATQSLGSGSFWQRVWENHSVPGESKAALPPLDSNLLRQRIRTGPVDIPPAIESKAKTSVGSNRLHQSVAAQTVYIPTSHSQGRH